MLLVLSIVVKVLLYDMLMVCVLVMFGILCGVNCVYFRSRSRSSSDVELLMVMEYFNCLSVLFFYVNVLNVFVVIVLCVRFVEMCMMCMLYLKLCMSVGNIIVSFSRSRSNFKILFRAYFYVYMFLFLFMVSV